MSLELLNTSSPRGVRPGATGFCTVGVTAQMSPALEERLTLLSGYRWLFAPGENQAEQNPVCFAHWRLTLGGRTLSVLSRVCDAGFDYSRRSNRLAHHVVVDAGEQAEAGPAWVMRQPGLLRTSWLMEPMVFENGPDIPQGAAAPAVCQAWAAAAGDAGWAGVLAESFAADPLRVANIIYSLGTDVLALVDESLRLLPASLRWQVTFATYFTDVPAGMSCIWRGCAAGSKAAADAQRQPGALLIDLTHSLPSAPDSPYALAARDGTGVAVAATYRPQSRAKSEYELAPAPPPRTVASSADAAASPIAIALANVPGSYSAPVETAAPSYSPAAPTADAPREQAPAANANTTRYLFWAIALTWPLIVAAGAIVFMRQFAPPANGSSLQTASGDGAAIAPPIPATTQSADPNVVPAAEHQAALAKLAGAREELSERQRTIDELRHALADAKDDLAAAKLRATSESAAESELQGLKSANVDLQAKLAAEAKRAPVVDARTIDLFGDSIELWSDDGGGAPDALKLNASPLPDSVQVDRSAKKIVVKVLAPVEGEFSKPAPTEIVAMKIEGGRVVLDRIGAKQVQISAPIRAWLQTSELTVERKGKPVGEVRFLPMRTLELNVDKETPPSLLPEIRWRDALKRAALAAPFPLPVGWTATASKDGQTLTLAADKIPAARFDVQLVLTGAGELQAQSTFATAYFKAVSALDDTATSKPNAARQTADATLAALRDLPPMTLGIVNRDNGLVLSLLRIRRGQ